MTMPTKPKKRALVIEDEPIVGRLCQRVLNANGFETDLVNNGLSAKEISAKQNYDLCVSDIRLPGITGIQLYEHWKSHKNPLANKTIFITGDTLNNNIRDFVKQSGRPCIMKPFDTEELSTAIKKLVP
jgi:DNA-binding NtrC family response regulator